MAAADVDSMSPDTSKLFFCHECTQEVYPMLPDYTCSECNSGFIEELSNAADNARSAEDSNIATFSDDWEDMHPNQLFGNGGRRREGGHVRLRNSGPHIMFQIGGGQMSPGGSANTAIDSFIQQVFNNLGVQVMRPSGGPGGSGGFNLGTSFGDYVWGPNGLDNIITQLLNQLESTGPPPADKSKIESLPVVLTQQKEVDENAECAVCRCEYEVGEEVKKLPCTHIFHPNCLLPWLELHDSCPICRCNLNGERPNMES